MPLLPRIGPISGRGRALRTPCSPAPLSRTARARCSSGQWRPPVDALRSSPRPASPGSHRGPATGLARLTTSAARVVLEASSSGRRVDTFRAGLGYARLCSSSKLNCALSAASTSGLRAVAGAGQSRAADAERHRQRAAAAAGAGAHWAFHAPLWASGATGHRAARRPELPQVSDDLLS
jgi:hypothetical protein